MQDQTSQRQQQSIHPQLKQFPLYFTNPSVDSISKNLTTFGNTQSERIIYMGPRFTSQLKLIKTYFSKSQIRSSCKESDPAQQIDGVKKYEVDCNIKQKYFPIRSAEYRLFTGCNPTLPPQELKFDSNFECGNLDLVVSLGSNRYDLFMRVDSNTKGHTCWFYYKVSNFTDKQTVVFNLVNFSRKQLSYNLGMKIYTYRQSERQWNQSGQNISFYRSNNCKYSQDNQNNLANYYTLSFTYTFKKNDSYVYFAYCIPYSYSYLQSRIRQIQSKCNNFVQIDRSNYTAGGLSIPIITIQQKIKQQKEIERQQQKKQICFIIGRLHPGQSQASWILDGFITFLCSQRAKQLRKKIIFKIVPMINIDGVVIGNFRTGIMGRDINRCFNSPDLFDEVKLIRQLANKYQPFMFLDFHGHSSMKNIFTFGPDYSIDHRYYLPSRLFSKLISKCTRSFRYYACSFKIPPNKRGTGRAIMLKNHLIKYCFTIQGSSFAYGIQRQQTIFNKNEYLQSGGAICQGLQKFINMIFFSRKKSENSMYQQKSILQISKKFKSSRNIPINFQSTDYNFNLENKKLIQQILTEQKEIQEKDNKDQDSDFEEGNQYSQKQLTKMLYQTQQVNINHMKKTKKKNKRQISQRISKKISTQQSPSKKVQHKIISSEVATSLQKYRNKGKKQNSNLEENQTELVLLHQSSHIPQIKVNFLLNPSKKLFSDDCLIIQTSVNLKNLNHLSLDYTLNKISQYQPLSEAKRIRDKASIILKKRNKRRQKQIRLQSKQTKVNIKQMKRSILPLLGKSNYEFNQQNSSVINQIFQNRQKARNHRISRNIKIMY